MWLKALLFLVVFDASASEFALRVYNVRTLPAYITMMSTQKVKEHEALDQTKEQIAYTIEPNSYVDLTFAALKKNKTYKLIASDILNNIQEFVQKVIFFDVFEKSPSIERIFLFNPENDAVLVVIDNDKGHLSITKKANDDLLERMKKSTKSSTNIFDLRSAVRDARERRSLQQDMIEARKSTTTASSSEQKVSANTDKTPAKKCGS